MQSSFEQGTDLSVHPALQHGRIIDVRTKFDLRDVSVGCAGSADKPYPSWHEMMSRLHRERAGQIVTSSPGLQPREWHDLVADMILKR